MTVDGQVSCFPWLRPNHSEAPEKPAPCRWLGVVVAGSQGSCDRATALVSVRKRMWCGSDPGPCGAAAPARCSCALSARQAGGGGGRPDSALGGPVPRHQLLAPLQRSGARASRCPRRSARCRSAARSPSRAALSQPWRRGGMFDCAELSVFVN